MTLTSVYSVPNAALYLYALLNERPAEANISHRVMPTAAEHLAFFESRPYLGWYLVMDGATVVGATYLSRQREVGISIFRKHQARGLAERAVHALLQRHPGRCIANVAPTNQPSIALFTKLGGRHIQNTYDLGGEHG